MPLAQFEPKKIYKKGKISDMRGPCQEGFHVPTEEEIQTLMSAGITLGAWTSGVGTNFSTYLKIPYSGRRQAGSAVNQQGTYGYYWTVTSYTDNKTLGQILALGSDYLDITSGGKSQGCSIRPFKDAAVTPDGSWTELYTNGIYWNSTLGLISIKNGAERITIADKNIGATAVYNYGDTLSETNCGKYFQRGNNYGFPYTGSVTTSATAVDATSYGPGNYYSSSTYITVSPRYSGNCTNLRGADSGKESVEIKKVYMWRDPVTFAQGPCPTGFHVPTNAEWVAVCNIILTTFGLAKSSTTMGTYLKMPLAGYRASSNGNTFYGKGTDVYYLECVKSGGAGTGGNSMYIGASNINPSNGTTRSQGNPIRAFKDEVVIPDSSWTTLYQGTGDAGIFWNSTDGIISISGDGTTRYTIADKNLGATTVYNSGDTLSQDNCGNYYQRGNNYGFPFTGSVTTSSTKVNATSYGPGNYYSSSTYINGGSSPADRSTVKNDNLWGGEDAVGTGDIQIRPPTKITVDYTTSQSHTGAGNNTSYYYGEKFTALKSGKIMEVEFFASDIGTLRIAQGSYASAAGTEYTISNVTTYTLPTPYEITAGQSYVISVKAGAKSRLYTYSTGSAVLPATGTAIRYDYATDSAETTTYTDRIWHIKSLTIEYHI